MTPIYRARLDGHLTRRLCPRAQATAREERRAIYPSMTDRELRGEYALTLAAVHSSVDGRAPFFCDLVADLVEQLALRGVRTHLFSEAAQ